MVSTSSLQVQELEPNIISPLIKSALGNNEKCRGISEFILLFSADKPYP
jgi:hypothetical protein